MHPADDRRSPKVLLNIASAHVSIRHGLAGPNHTLVTACAAGAHSLIDAARLIALGEADAAVAGGAEACVSPLAITGFARARCGPRQHSPPLILLLGPALHPAYHPTARGGG